MPANWKRFEDNLVRAIKNREARDEDRFAKLLTDEYDRTIVNSAQDLLLGNRVIIVNKSLLETALRSAFKLAKFARNNDESQRIMRVFINTGIISYWTGGQLSITNPPPGAVSVVTNMITFPGIPPDVKIVNSSKPEDFARELSIRLRTHALSVMVLTTGVTATGVPVVVPISGIN